MKRIYIILLCVFSLTRTVYSRDTNAVRYFPLCVGNVYLYYEDNCCPPHSSYKKSRILKDSVLNNRKYYYLYNFYNYYNGWYRVDTLRGNLYKYDSTNSCLFTPYEKFIDSLSAFIGDSIRECNIFTGKICTNISNFNAFGNIFLGKTYWKSLSGGPYSGQLSYIYLKNIGYYSYYAEYNHPPSSRTILLLGCYVNGILYGDTNTTNIKVISTELQTKFYLSQNYPNPFNPLTKIKFELPKAGPVKISVFDVTGREVAVLVNETLQAGVYETTFDAGGTGLSSGVYFYRIQAGDFRETRRMVMIK